ncbi:MAG TPA: hypothetical protein VF590_14530, partial [Isosphaeraceae bacterium]
RGEGERSVFHAIPNYFVTAFARQHSAVFAPPSLHAAWGLHPSAAGFAAHRDAQDPGFAGQHAGAPAFCPQAIVVAAHRAAVLVLQAAEALQHAESPWTRPQVSGLAAVRSHGQQVAAALASPEQVSALALRQHEDPDLDAVGSSARAARPPTRMPNASRPRIFIRID